MIDWNTIHYPQKHKPIYFMFGLTGIFLFMVLYSANAVKSAGWVDDRRGERGNSGLAKYTATNMRVTCE